VLNRIAKKYACKFKDLDVSVMLDDLTLVDSATFVPFTKPEGANWRKRTVKREVVEKAVAKNRDYLTNKLEKNKKYSEVFVSMGKKYAAALPDLAKYGTTILFPTGKGLGPKAAALKQWLTLK
jgi:hypothetical protein